MKYVNPLSLFSELIKNKRGRLLGLDVGDKYVGLAVSDSGNKVASPVCVLHRKKSNTDLMASDFQKLISELSLEGFVVGCPYDKWRREGREALPIKLFIEDLCKTGKLDGISFTYWNECFTSKSVELLLKPLGLHPNLSKTINDKFAAAGILQGYLDFCNRKMKSDSTQ